MTLDFIKQCVDNGLKVYNGNKNYEVIKGKYEYLVVCKLNDYTVGLKGMPLKNYFVCSCGDKNDQ